MMKIIDSPREVFQSFSRSIDTGEKVRYIGMLLKAGFDTLETGSIVSPKVIPQMADSLDVLHQLDLSNSDTGLMCLAVNEQGAKILACEESVTHISYPFSFSPAFLKLNMKTTVDEAFATAGSIVERCAKKRKTAVIYLSMAFGNPYGDPWNMELLIDWISRLVQSGAAIIPLSNVSVEITPGQISEVFPFLLSAFPGTEFGLHLHTRDPDWRGYMEAAWRSGVRRFDGVINGRGGCPMTGKEMLGNMKTENLVAFGMEKRVCRHFDMEALHEASLLAGEIFH